MTEELTCPAMATERQLELEHAFRGDRRPGREGPEEGIGGADERTMTLLLALGKAVTAVWSNLPQDVQQELFEHAVSAQDDATRGRLAVFLHSRRASPAASNSLRRQCPRSPACRRAEHRGAVCVGVARSARSPPAHEQAHGLAIPAHDQPIAVVLDLVHPVGPGRRLVGKGRNAVSRGEQPCLRSCGLL
jgi:hypothetical protein